MNVSIQEKLVSEQGFVFVENEKSESLPELEAWLEKRKPGGVVPKYQKRWCVVKGAHLLWSAKQRSITNDADRNQRKKFNGSINLMQVESFSALETSSNNKFIVCIQYKNT